MRFRRWQKQWQLILWLLFFLIGSFFVHLVLPDASWELVKEWLRKQGDLLAWEFWYPGISVSEGTDPDIGSKVRKKEEEVKKPEIERTEPEEIPYLKEQLADYDFLMRHFYTVHPTAAAGRDLLQAEVFLGMDLSLEKAADAEGPQILIYHTHSQEEYLDFHDGNKNATVITAGDYLTELLQKKGYRVIHDTTTYDLQGGELDRSKAYNYALEGISGILQTYPSIQVVLDVHRDGVPDDTHLVSEINGKQTALVMFFNGTSETPDGPIAYLPNPCRTGNLAFSFQLKLCAEARYPGFTRKIYLKGLRYNQHLRTRSALIEVGAQTNTLEEALYAMEPLSELFCQVLGEP